MGYAPHIERILDEAHQPLSVSEIFVRLVEATASIPSQEDLSDAFVKVGRGPVSAEDYATALTDFVPVVEDARKVIEAHSATPSLPVLIVKSSPLWILAMTALAVGVYWIAALILALAAVFIYAVLHPQSRLTASLPWIIGFKQKPHEGPSRYELRSGVMVILLGATFLFGSIWGRSALYASGVERGDQPLLEVMLMIPMPLLGVTLLLWGLGRSLKGLVGVASGEDKQ